MENLKEMTPVQVLRTYFGTKPGQSISDFARELKELSAEEKAELVELAAIQLGVTVKSVS
jgi:hypothetical protein